ncbi:hypothetical protein BJY00DRAFT_206098 [Aspergillus carlsbadensis]|nr:hypothetical protein BJY00DRAFT_206098 [Aspergillus carlsbadensis]
MSSQLLATPHFSPDLSPRKLLWPSLSSHLYPAWRTAFLVGLSRPSQARQVPWIPLPPSPLTLAVFLRVLSARGTLLDSTVKKCKGAPLVIGYYCCSNSAPFIVLFLIGSPHPFAPFSASFTPASSTVSFASPLLVVSTGLVPTATLVRDDH